ncbi:MAG TPA: FeoB-associated Cys-rich membrane protein [Oscillospiraceae bacterium]|nr:FeoB-associated Cys-rich membrane protein [Oscillospiraceae bacterium]HPW00474.1 FeoB-associated Cys-rich membrane protein [Oscillospiraceae bacterium]
MFLWMIENWGTVVVGLLLAAALAAIVANMVKSKRSGKSACGCECAGCPMSGSCHQKK